MHNLSPDFLATGDGDWPTKTSTDLHSALLIPSMPQTQDESPAGQSDHASSYTNASDGHGSISSLVCSHLHCYPASKIHP